MEDRRDALRGIRALSKKYPREVGSLCLEVLIGAVQNDRADSEVVGYALESLWNVMDSQQSPELETGLAVQVSKAFVKTAEHVTMILNLLEDFEFQVRRPATCLLTTLLKNCLAEVQEAVLVSPMGISRVMDLLSDSREVVRNDALLLLLQLTRSNRQIQKIVAFDNAFDRLLGVIQEEGWSDGGIVVEDCLMITHNLLNGNNSNQAFFREASHIQLVVPFFQQLGAAGETTSWHQQKVTNVRYMLLVLRTLVSPSNPQQATATCQKSIMQCGLLKLLCEFMFASGVPTEILVDTITTVAEVIRGCETNQKFFEEVTPHTDPPRSAILALLMSMVTEKQPLPLRLAALYCFQSYIFRYEEGQNKIINTLLPSTTSSPSQPQITAGQVLCAGLFGSDPFSNWSTATAIACSLNAGLKPQLLRVQLSMSGRGQVTLLQQITALLSEKTDLKVQTKIGLLILLCCWLGDCSVAVAQFLNDSANVMFLTGQLEQHHTSELEQLGRDMCAALLGICLAYHDGSSTTYTPDTLRQIINHRIGRDAFTQSLAHISSSEFFTSASKSPHLSAETLDHVCFDHPFTIFFKQVSDTIHRALDSNSLPQPPTQNGLDPNSSTSIEDHDSIVSQYKELIRNLDEDLSSLREKYAKLETTSQQENETIREQGKIISELKEQLAAVREMGREVEGVGEAGGDSTQLQQQVTSLQRMQEAQRQELALKSVQVEQLQRDLEEARSSQVPGGPGELEKLREEILQLKAENEALLTEKNSLDSQLEELQSTQQPQSGGTQEVEELQQQLAQLKTSYQEAKGSNKTMEKEMNDLLILLAEHDTRNKKYRNLLMENKIPLPEEDEESEEDEEDEEEEEDGEGGQD